MRRLAALGRCFDATADAFDVIDSVSLAVSFLL
jgi:hypothetical protein